MKRKTCLSFLVILILLSQCSKKTSTINPSPSVASITWEIPGGLSTREWNECHATNCLQHATLVMDGLFKLPWMTDDWELQNSLAQSFDLQKKSATISIKRNVNWSDGKKLSAEDFLLAWKKVLKDCQTIERFPIWKQVNGALSYCRGEKKWKDVGIRSVDDLSLEISLERPSQEILRSLAHPLFFPRRDAPKPGSLVLGPYQLTEEAATADTGRGLTYTPNPKYHGVRPTIGEIILRPQNRMKSALSAAISRQVQLAGPVPETAGLENVDKATRMLVPTHVRWGAATFLTSTSSSWQLLDGFQWKELQALGLSRALPCGPHRLCGLTTMSSETAKPSRTANLSVLLHAPDSTAHRLAENAAAQWRALHQAKVQIVTSRNADPKQAGIWMDIFAYETNPFSSLYPTGDLWLACQAVANQPKIAASQTSLEPSLRWSRIARPLSAAGESEIRRFERKLREPPRCVPLAVETQLFVRDPLLERLVWTAYGTWDFSSATFPTNSSSR